MTVSSFTSLSLSPPLVTFHVATPSRTLDAIRTSGLLNFHVLAGDVRGARVAHHFTGGNTKHTWSRKVLHEAGLRVAGRNTDADDELVVTGTEPPVLDGPGVMYVLRCKLFEEASGGVMMVRDHAVVVAEVVEIIETSEKTDGHEQFGLVYADRHYRKLGDTLVRKDACGE
jgi:flavin reductase (DIM6/NTAB) family NADH-FMN oxidoreductase RutF